MGSASTSRACSVTAQTSANPAFITTRSIGMVDMLVVMCMGWDFGHRENVFVFATRLLQHALDACHGYSATVLPCSNNKPIS